MLVGNDDICRGSGVSQHRLSRSPYAQATSTSYTTLLISYLVSLEPIGFLSNTPVSNQLLCTAFRKGILHHETRTSYSFILKIKSLKLKAI